MTAATTVTPTPPTLGSRSISAVFWGAGGTVLRMVMQIGAQVVLARLLGPQQYGIFAIGASVISLSAFFSDVGLAYGLIQKDQVNDRDVRFVFTWQVILGVTVSAAVWLAAGPVAGFFGEPQAEAVLRVLSLLCLLNALAAPSMNLLKRRIDFKRLQIAQLVSYLVGYIGVGIPLAMAGAKVWALVAAWLVQAGVSLLLLYAAARHPLRPLFWYEHGRQQSGYGGTVFITNLVNWAINNVDRVVVGRVFGSHDIGLYATSYNLLYSPTASVLGVVQPVFFSASSRVADDPQRVLRGYLALIGMVMLLALPAFTVVALTSGSFIALLYGPQWTAAAALCRPVALAMPFFLIWGFSTPLLWTSGRPEREFAVQLPVALVWLVVCLLASRHSLLMLAWCVLALYVVRCLVVVVAAARSMQLEASALWASARGGLAVTLVVAVAVAAGHHAAAAMPPAPRLGVSAVIAVLVWLGVLRALPGLVGVDAGHLFGRLLARLPSRAASAFGFLTGRKNTQ